MLFVAIITLHLQTLISGTGGGGHEGSMSQRPTYTSAQERGRLIKTHLSQPPQPQRGQESRLGWRTAPRLHGGETEAVCGGRYLGPAELTRRCLLSVCPCLVLCAVRRSGRQRNQTKRQLYVQMLMQKHPHSHCVVSLSRSLSTCLFGSHLALQH